MAGETKSTIQSHIKHGQITKNKKINEYICHFFKYMCEENQQKLRKKFDGVKSNQIMHTLRELILGAYLSANGFRVRYDFVINLNGKKYTPDWCILDDDSSVIGIVELFNFHIDEATEREIRKHSKLKENFVYWRDGNKNNIDRLYQKIEGKVCQYSLPAETLKVPYVVAVFGTWETAVDFDEICSCLLGNETGLFDVYPEMSGVLYFVEQNALRYLFNYAEDPNALQPINMPTGIFPPEAT